MEAKIVNAEILMLEFRSIKIQVQLVQGTGNMHRYFLYEPIANAQDAKSSVLTGDHMEAFILQFIAGSRLSTEDHRKATQTTQRYFADAKARSLKPINHGNTAA